MFNNLLLFNLHMISTNRLTYVLCERRLSKVIDHY